MRWNSIVYHYTKLNKEQPVRFYTEEEIAEYIKTKPISFFLIPSKKARKLEKWLDTYLPKTGIDEVAELKRAIMLYKSIQGAKL